MPGPVVHLMVAGPGPVFVGCFQRALYQGSRSKNFPFPTMMLYAAMRPTGDRYTNRYPATRYSPPINALAQEAQVSRGQGRVCDSLVVVLAWFPPSFLFRVVYDLRQRGWVSINVNKFFAITSSVGSWRMSTRP